MRVGRTTVAAVLVAACVRSGEALEEPFGFVPADPRESEVAVHGAFGGLGTSLRVRVAEAAAAPSPDYDTARASLESQRLALAEEYLAADQARRQDVLARARRVLVDAIEEWLIPAWYGTAWGYNGTTQIPGEGRIACGYFVSTVLLHAGLHVDRVRLAQQPAEHIIKTLVSEDSVDRYRLAPAADVVSAVRADEDGIYVVGLDKHVALLVKRGEDVQMCHASERQNRGMRCEDAATAPGMQSRYHVVGKLFEDELVRNWLAEAPIPTVIWR